MTSVTSALLRRAALCTLTLFFASGAAADSDLDFYPSSGTPKGGTEVHVHAKTGRYWRFSDPQVLFGGIPSPNITRVNDSTIIAVTPPHEVDIVDVQVLDRGGVYTVGTFVFVPELEQILIPIALTAVDGGRGTRWISEISVYNDSDERVPIDPQICYSIGSPRFCSRPVRWVEPRSTMKIEPPEWTGHDHPAMRLWPPAEQADRLSFTVRLHELSKGAGGPGVEIPVARARDFKHKQVSLPSVPTALSGYRSTLRIYSSDPEVTVRIRDEETGQILEEYRLERGAPTDVDLFDTATLHDLLSSPAVRAREKVRIEVEARLPVWAMLSLTHNETQHVLLFTPQ